MFPLHSETPTVTIVRVKTFLSGILSTVFQFTESLNNDRFYEDNLLNQMHIKLGEKARVVFYGDDIWTPQFGEWFTRYDDIDNTNVNDLESNDRHVRKTVEAEMKESGGDFDFLIMHTTGVDCAGHTHGSRHPDIQRKLLETEQFIADMIDWMDEETTLVIFGDHGMTEEGSHGGSSELEMHTTMFTYSKKPFPIAKKYNAMRENFKKLDRTIKQADLAPIGAMLLNLPYPFSNLGVGHPLFAETDDFEVILTKMRKNVEQVLSYVREYCRVTESGWCSEEIAAIESGIADLDLIDPKTDQERVQKMTDISVFLNEKYEHLKQIWLEYDLLAMRISIAMALHLLFFH